MSDTRAEFEAWAKSKMLGLDKRHDGPVSRYLDDETQFACMAWQHQQSRIEELEARVDRLRGQLQNSVNHMDGVKRRFPSLAERLDPAIESANKALYETLHESEDT